MFYNNMQISTYLIRWLAYTYHTYNISENLYKNSYNIIVLTYYDKST